MARHAVRWMDPNQGLFGATINLTFSQPSLFTQRWVVRFRLADNATQIKDYWGSWSVLELVRGWYQIQPHEDLRLNDLQQVYFSFNGVWNTSKGDWNTTRLACTAVEIQVSDPSNPHAIPLVYQLKDAGEFASEPVPFEVPSVPFGNFQRNAAHPGIPVAKMQSTELPKVHGPYPKSNFLGMHIVIPLLAFFTAVILFATFLSWRWRRIYRQQLAQMRANPEKYGLNSMSATATEIGVPIKSVDEKDANFDGAYAGYYMMMDGAWDGQVVREGDADPVDMYGRPYSVAPVVTDAQAFDARQPGNRRTTLLIPGKEYRKTLLERGVPMPAEWLPPHLRQSTVASPPKQQNILSNNNPNSTNSNNDDSPTVGRSDLALYDQYSNKPSRSVPSFVPPMPPAHPPSILGSNQSAYASNAENASATVQSRSLTGARLRKDNIQPSRLFAETVPAVEGAVYAGQERETMIAVAKHDDVVPVHNAQPIGQQLVSKLEPREPSPSDRLNVSAQAFDNIALSPGWPIGSEVGSIYSPKLTDEQQQHGSGASPPKGNAMNKPLPAVGGWNMI